MQSLDSVPYFSIIIYQRRGYRMWSVLCCIQRHTTTTTGRGGGHVYHCQTASESETGNDF